MAAMLIVIPDNVEVRFRVVGLNSILATTLVVSQLHIISEKQMNLLPGCVEERHRRAFSQSHASFISNHMVGWPQSIWMQSAGMHD
jgi:hypothetical protein